VVSKKKSCVNSSNLLLEARYYGYPEQQEDEKKNYIFRCNRKIFIFLKVAHA
jgi:hypothetical protein